MEIRCWSWCNSNYSLKWSGGGEENPRQTQKFALGINFEIISSFYFFFCRLSTTWQFYFISTSCDWRQTWQSNNLVLSQLGPSFFAIGISFFWSLCCFLIVGLQQNLVWNSICVWVRAGQRFIPHHLPTGPFFLLDEVWHKAKMRGDSRQSWHWNKKMGAKPEEC